MAQKNFSRIPKEEFKYIYWNSRRILKNHIVNLEFLAIWIKKTSEGNGPKNTKPTFFHRNIDRIHSIRTSSSDKSSTHYRDATDDDDGPVDDGGHDDAVDGVAAVE